MDARFYNSDEIDIEQLANNLENFYRSQGYQVQQIGNRDQMMVQLKKGSDFEALIGMQAALSVIIQRSSGGVIATIGQQKWIEKAAVGAVGIIAAPVLWPLMLTAGAGAIRQASLANQVLNVVDGLVRQQRPGIQVGPIPVQIMPQMQQLYVPPPQYAAPAYLPPPQPQYVPPQPVIDAVPAPAPSSKKLRCPNCNTPYEPGDTFCTGCGKPLVTLCPNCKTEIKDNASFCPKCGASLFQSSSGTYTTPTVQPPPPVQQAPAYTPPPVPPVQQTPTYTPPQAPIQPKVVYNPPPVQQTPVYTPPTPPEPYVPPTPQEPPVQSPTTITYTPAASRQPQAAPPQPQREPEVYYTPPPDLHATLSQPPAQTPPVKPKPATPKPAQSQQADVPYYTPPANLPPVAPQPIKPKTTARPAFDPKAIWGYLTLSDGKQMKLSGERAVVGRADHDIGGLQPEVDLSDVQGSDTVSRIHAALEHIGSTYTVTDLNSTNATRLNGKRLEPDKAMPLNEGDKIEFGKVSCTFKKA